MKLGRITLKVERIVDLDDPFQVDAANMLIEDDVLGKDHDQYLHTIDNSLTPSDISEDVIMEANDLRTLSTTDDDEYAFYDNLPLKTEDPKMPSKGWAPAPTSPKTGWSKIP